MEKIENKTEFEFIALMAFLMALVALAIDALLPAIGIIGEELQVINKNNNQLLVSILFLGLAFGQLFFGPLSDALGRKTAVYYGLLLYLVGSILCIFSYNFELIIIGRLIQGIGLSSPRSVSIAMVRDKFQGDYMAKIMSFVTVIFILVPTIAPSLGQLLLNRFNWQSIFWMQLILTFLLLIWFAIRQNETLTKEHRIKFTFEKVKIATKELLQRKEVIKYTLISGLISGAFITYISSSQQVFHEHYDLVEEFPIIFALLAISVAFSTFLNGKLVLKLGMYPIVRKSLYLFVISSFSYFITSLFFDSKPPVTITIGFFALQFFSIGFLFGNLKSLTMQPIGHIAGIGSAITGFFSTIIAVPISVCIGSFLNSSPTPLFKGFFLFVDYFLFFYFQKTILNKTLFHKANTAFKIDNKR